MKLPGEGVRGAVNRGGCEVTRGGCRGAVNRGGCERAANRGTGEGVGRGHEGAVNRGGCEGSNEHGRACKTREQGRSNLYPCCFLQLRYG